jgi:hypothetical protein
MHLDDSIVLVVTWERARPTPTDDPSLVVLADLLEIAFLGLNPASTRRCAMARPVRSRSGQSRLRFPENEMLCSLPRRGPVAVISRQGQIRLMGLVLPKARLFMAENETLPEDMSAY